MQNEKRFPLQERYIASIGRLF